jgi:pimeloyl-ACP methyl ester carboxylesterase
MEDTTKSVTITKNDKTGKVFHKPPHVYILPFDRPEGGNVPLMPHARLLDSLTGVDSASYSSIVVMAHGWQTHWDAAIALFTDWFACIHECLLERAGNDENTFKSPLYVGVFWPSIQGLTTVEYFQQLYHGRPDTFSPEQISKVIEDRDNSPAAQMVLAMPDDVDGDDIPASSSSNSARVEALSEQVEASHGMGGFEINQPMRWRDYLHVWSIKNRAGLVGRSTPMQAFLHRAKTTGLPLHLMGHSFGCRLMLEAAKTANHFDSEWKATSLTLIQPAVSRWVFSDRTVTIVFRRNTEGMFADVPIRAVVNPVLVLYSECDGPLVYAYPLALGGEAPLIDEPRAGDTIEVGDGGKLGRAALGAYGPDWTHTKGRARCIFYRDDAKYRIADAKGNGDSTARVVGVKGQWNHYSDGWSRIEVARTVTMLHCQGTIWCME